MHKVAAQHATDYEVTCQQDQVGMNGICFRHYFSEVAEAVQWRTHVKVRQQGHAEGTALLRPPRQA